MSRRSSRVKPPTSGLESKSDDKKKKKKGQYYIRFGPNWFPQEAIVEAGVSEIPLQRLNSDGFYVQRGLRLGVGGERLEMCKLDSAEIIRSENLNANSVEGYGNLEKSNNEPPATVLSTLNQSQREAFLRLWDNIPVHLQAIHFDFEESLWTETDKLILEIYLTSTLIDFRNTALIWGMSL
ncbi:MAG: hypothetical protein ABJQ38_18205 [Flavobacteriaceae bacterium]